MRNALLEIAVAAEHPRMVLVAAFAGSQRETDTHGDALSQRTGRDLDAGHDAALGMTCTA